MSRRALPLLLLVLPLVAFLAGWLALGEAPWSAETLLARRDALKAAAEAAPNLTLAIFVAVYFVIISSALPVGPPMSLIAGFLFGRWIGTAAILTAATGGALVVYTLARLSAGTALGERLRAKAGPVYALVAADMKANAFGYLIVMRLVPFFPFFLVNLLAGIVGIPARTFALATLLGRIPAAFLYVSLGEELGGVSRLDDLAQPRLLLILLGLALLAALPVALAHRRARLPGKSLKLRPSADCLPEAVRPVSPPSHVRPPSQRASGREDAE